MHASGSADLAAMMVLSAREAIVVEKLDGAVTVWNPAAEELYGYPAVMMVGSRAQQFYPPGEAAALRRVADGHDVGEFVSERTHRDGTTVRVRVRATAILDGTGATIGVATTSWADTASRLGHELRTPLNAIIGFTGTLLMRLPGPLNDEQVHQLRLVQTSAEQLLSRINQLP
ncbi:histidine kinase dimerization/phospho-acceptor domain-containing protein [Actinoplanes solisilvae]|uniref:histidine kinase dimerization/phospho-acceptor domain-containing protein n=1 Tax=Actinoplanes solisilvae TaxID=2486853 RepID=UPI00196B3970|nr:histidine kinase dimerization/phospho-acceptor domain-containing protein [Actinoplanes solisilvae]